MIAIPRPHGSVGERRRRSPLHALERALLVVAGLDLCALPWVLGAMVPTAQWIGGALATASLILALWPRRYTEPTGEHPSFTLVMWPKLLRSPLFWVGVLFIVCVAIQMLNPAWSFVLIGKGWALRREHALAWLPHGVRGTPFAMMNAWRMLLIYGSAWMLACALWVGLTRARSARILLTLLVVNGLILSLLAFGQRVAGTKKIFGTVQIQENAWSFVSSFVYKNHAGAYFNLIVAAAFALALYHAVRARQQLLKSNPAILFVLLALMNSITVFISYSRAALLLWGVLIVVVLILYLSSIWRKIVGFNVVSAVLALICLLSAGLWFKVGLMRVDFATRYFHRLGEGRAEGNIAPRLVVYEATWEMARNSLILGNGAGSFRFIFPQYQIRRPALLDARGKMAGLWEHAHNDYLEFLAEFGLLGVVLALSLVVAFAIALWRAGTLRHGHGQILLAALLLLLVHAAVDFPLQNPAIICAALALAIACLKWVEQPDGAEVAQASPRAAPLPARAPRRFGR